MSHALKSRRSAYCPGVQAGGICAVLIGALLISLGGWARGEVVFPGDTWEERTPEQMGLDGAKLEQLAEQLAGRGCVIKDGYVVKRWGDQTQVADWLSSAKPVLSTLLFFAIEEGLVKSVDQPIAEFGWPLKEKDRTMTFRHLGAMSSGYARPEVPGAAWAYNDYAIQLYQRTLFDKVFNENAKVAAENPKRLGALQLQDGLKFSSKRRISASVRDFSRISWFWLNRGRWGDQQILPRHYFDEFMKPQTPRDLAQTETAETDDYLGIQSFGGGSDHFARCGPGIYGFNWWFNSTGRGHRETRTWPDAPPDTVMSIGAGGNNTAMIPSLNLVLACAGGNWRDLRAGEPRSKINRALKLVASAAGYKPTAAARVTGEMKKWHTVTLTFVGPESSEAAEPNPFTDYRMEVTFEKEARRLVVPGYFAADGNAAETSADAGRMWRARFLPDEEGRWTYRVSFREGPGVAISEKPDEGKATAFDGVQGSFTVGPADRTAPGFLAKGSLDYVGERYLRFAETGEPFIKGGADSPENFLAFADFDGTKPTHRYEPHAQDWRAGDPTWKDLRGKNIIGALNYLASKKMNSVYFLTMNVKGDGKDVWPWISETSRERYDCSKLDQWEVVFEHMDRLGVMMHVVHQEQENDQLMDKGELGPERRLYYRELIARFGHHPALVWNMGEENTNTDEQRKAFAKYIHDVDAYDHPVVLHTFPSQIQTVYTNLLGYAYMEGPSLQLGHMERVHQQTDLWIRRSREAGRPWFVCLDEIGPASVCVKPDAEDPEHADVVRHALWGHLIAGGAGVEWIFAYTWPREEGAKHQDIRCENWRLWGNMWDLTRVALDFFHAHLPFTEMEANDKLVDSESAWCLAKKGEVYAVYLPGGNETGLHLPAGTFTKKWFNPRKGGALIPDGTVKGPGSVALGRPPADQDRDWVVLVEPLNVER